MKLQEYTVHFSGSSTETIYTTSVLNAAILATAIKLHRGLNHEIVVIEDEQGNEYRGGLIFQRERE